jgi:NAD(P)-dependent dehydrogenase (short-subunit alcohol dehydrogenase family)
MQTPDDNERRTLLLTGASRGIGHATVKRFQAAGWRVITCSRHAFPEKCPWAGGAENHVKVDLADPADRARAIGEMREKLDGRLDALVNNAAISPKGEGGKRLGTLDTTLELWRQVFEVNFFATISLARGLVAELATAKGSIVNVTSIAGGRGLCHLQGGARRADARDGDRFRASRHPRERHRARRDRYGDPVARHG